MPSSHMVGNEILHLAAQQLLSRVTGQNLELLLAKTIVPKPEITAMPSGSASIKRSTGLSAATSGVPSPLSWSRKSRANWPSLAKSEPTRVFVRKCSSGTT